MADDIRLPGAIGADPKDPVTDDPKDEVDWEKKSADLEAQLTASKEALDKTKKEGERNLRRQSSSLQRQINDANVKAKSVEDNWQNRFHTEKMAGMEDEEALRYDNLLMAERLEEARKETADVRTAAAQAQNAAGYVQHFNNMGIPTTELNTAGSLQDLADSGYAAVEKRDVDRSAKMDDYSARLELQDKELAALRSGQADPNALAIKEGDVIPPKVATNLGQATPGARTMNEALEAAKVYFDGNRPTEEMLYRAVETKQLPVTVLPGLEGMPKE